MAGNLEVTAQQAYSRQYYLANREAQLEKDRLRRQVNPEAGKLRMRAWREANREKVRAYNRELQRKRRENPVYRMNCAMSCGIYACLTGRKKRTSWQTLVGYTTEELKAHLESKFVEGMSWDNYGKWHVDHIRPLSSFDITDSSCPDFIEAWSLTNLQPLWAEDNMKKGAKYGW